MSINIRRCYFHSISPLKHYKTIQNLEKEKRDRLNFILDYGYLVPGKDLPNILPKEYKNFNLASNDDCIYLAQHILTELPSIGGSFHQGEFSAFFEHIRGNPSFVFDEHVIEGKKVKYINHFLSEEICLQDRIPISEMIALALPFSTPFDKIKNFFQSYEDLDKLFPDFRKEREDEILKILDNKEESIKQTYKEIEKYQDILKQHNISVPCIRYDGSIYDINKEIFFLKTNNEKIKKMIKH